MVAGSVGSLANSQHFATKAGKKLSTIGISFGDNGNEDPFMISELKSFRSANMCSVQGGATRNSKIHVNIFYGIILPTFVVGSKLTRDPVGIEVESLKTLTIDV